MTPPPNAKLSAGTLDPHAGNILARNVLSDFYAVQHPASGAAALHAAALCQVG